MGLAGRGLAGLAYGLCFRGLAWLIGVFAHWLIGSAGIAVYMELIVRTFHNTLTRVSTRISTGNS